MTDRIRRNKAEWKKLLTPEQYQVCRCHGTEPPYSGQYAETTEPGIYTCTCCGQELFDSDTKYDSGCGWPSYWQPIAPENVIEKPDKSLGMIRMEVLCSKCDAHLGHLFPDGPEPTGLRYCINSVALDLKPKP